MFEIDGVNDTGESFLDLNISENLKLYLKTTKGCEKVGQDEMLDEKPEIKNLVILSLLLQSVYIQ
jgi:hypothetical protein